MSRIHSPDSDRSTVVPALPPLSLVPLERFMLRQETADHPLVFRIVMRLNGHCDRARFTEAHRLAGERQPLLCSCLGTQGKEQFWERVIEAPPIEWLTAATESEALDACPLEGILLAEAPGMRTTVCELPQQVIIILDVHHAVSDGQGLRRFIIDWYLAYTQLMKGEIVSLAELEESRLSSRGEYPPSPNQIAPKEGLRNLWLTIRGRTARLRQQNKLRVSEGRHQRFQDIGLSPEQTASVRHALKKSRRSMNDVALTAALLTFARQFPHRCGGKWITIANPVDLRRPSDIRTPACNRLGFAFLRRKLFQTEDVAALQHSIVEQMNYVKRHHIGAEFIHGLEAAENLSGLIAFATSRFGWFVPTLQLTCLGDTTRGATGYFAKNEGRLDFEGMQLESVAVFSPPVAGVPLSLGLCETNLRLCLSLWSDARYFEEAHSAKFLNEFVETFLELAGSEQAATSGVR